MKQLHKILVYISLVGRSSLLFLRGDDFLDFAEKMCPNLNFIIILVIQEGTLPDLRDSGTLIWLEGQQAHDQILEVLRQVSALDCLEVGIITLVLDHVVVLVFEDLRAVWEFALHHNEYKYTHREQVDLCSIVFVVGEHFGSDIAWRAYGASHLG